MCVGERGILLLLLFLLYLLHSNLPASASPIICLTLLTSSSLSLLPPLILVLFSYILLYCSSFTCFPLSLLTSPTFYLSLLLVYSFSLPPFSLLSYFRSLCIYLHFLSSSLSTSFPLFTLLHSAFSPPLSSVPR